MLHDEELLQAGMKGKVINTQDIVNTAASAGEKKVSFDEEAISDDVVEDESEEYADIVEEEIEEEGNTNDVYQEDEYEDSDEGVQGYDIRPPEKPLDSSLSGMFWNIIFI